MIACYTRRLLSARRSDWRPEQGRSCARTTWATGRRPRRISTRISGVGTARSSPSASPPSIRAAPPGNYAPFSRTSGRTGRCPTSYSIPRPHPKAISPGRSTGPAPLLHPTRRPPLPTPAASANRPCTPSPPCAYSGTLSTRVKKRMPGPSCVTFTRGSLPGIGTLPRPAIRKGRVS